MTKRKAIEEAMNRLRAEAKSLGAPYPDSVEKEMDGAYEAGRIAELRAAARICSNVDDQIRFQVRANALAKKARAAK